jgi:chromosome segregation ATPase
LLQQRKDSNLQSKRHRDALRKANGVMEERIAGLELQLKEVLDTVHTAGTTAAELRDRIVSENTDKARILRETQALANQRNRMARENLKTGHSVLNTRQDVRGISESRTGYIEAVGRLSDENAHLRRQIEEEQQRLDSLVESARYQKQQVWEQQEELRRDANSVEDERQALRQADERDLAWLAGRADAIARATSQDGHHKQTHRGLLHLRDAALRLWRVLDEITTERLFEESGLGGST